MYGTKLTAKDVGAFETNWDTTKGEGPAEAWEDALYLLPEGWEERMEEAAARAAIEERRVASLARITQYEARTEQVRPDVAGVEPLTAPAEPKGEYGPLEGMPTVATHTVDRDHLYDPSLTGCPVCEDFVPTECWWGGEDAWMCAGCGYSPEFTLSVDPTLPPVPAPVWGRGSDMTPYRGEELASQQVIYHDGEPVMPEPAVVGVDEYPSVWDVSVSPSVYFYDRTHVRRMKANVGWETDDGDWLG